MTTIDVSLHSCRENIGILSVICLCVNKSTVRIMLTAASQYITAKAVDLRTSLPEQTWRYWIWVILMSLLIVPCTRVVLSRKRRNELLWKIPGCNVNYFFLFLAVAKSLFNNTIKTNICKYTKVVYLICCYKFISL